MSRTWRTCAKRPVTDLERAVLETKYVEAVNAVARWYALADDADSASVRSDALDAIEQEASELLAAAGVPFEFPDWFRGRISA